MLVLCSNHKKCEDKNCIWTRVINPEHLDIYMYDSWATGIYCPFEMKKVTINERNVENASNL